jgi:hypothetical protein
MYFDDLETDLSYLSQQVAINSARKNWPISGNRFELRMAANLKPGSKLFGIERAALCRVLSTATATRQLGITVDIETIDGSNGDAFNVEVLGVIDNFISPWKADNAANLELALARMHFTRPTFVLSIIPRGMFWVHSEYALGGLEFDWATVWKTSQPT